MRLTIRLQKNRVNYYVIYILLVLTFVAAAAQIVDTRQETSAGLPRAVRQAANYAMFVLAFVYDALFILRKRQIQFLTASTLLYLVYETVISLYYRGVSLSLVRSLVIDGYTWPLTMIAYYFYFRFEYRGERIETAFRRLVVIGLLFSMVLMIPNIQRHLVDYGFLGRTIAPIYYLIGFLTFVYLFCRRRTGNLFTLAIAVMILLSTKRGPLLIIIIGFIFRELTHAHISNRLTQRVQRYLRFIFIALIMVLAVSWYNNRYDIQSISRLLNLLDDQGSGRFLAWTQVMQAFRASSLLKKLLGHGFHAVAIQIMPLGRGIYAHNSYLEVLYDMGIIGLVWLLVNLVYLFVQFFRMRKSRYPLAPTLAFAISQLLVMSVASYFFEKNSFVMPPAILWAMCVGAFQNRHLRTDLQGENFVFLNRSKTA